jgi:hypothetical protein
MANHVLAGTGPRSDPGGAVTPAAAEQKHAALLHAYASFRFHLAHLFCFPSAKLDAMRTGRCSA